MDGDNCVASIVFPGQQGCSFNPLYYLTQRIQLTAQVGVYIFALAGQFEISGDVLSPPAKVSFGSQSAFQTLLFPHDLLRILRIRPEIWVGSLLLNFG